MNIWFCPIFWRCYFSKRIVSSYSCIILFNILLCYLTIYHLLFKFCLHFLSHLTIFKFIFKIVLKPYDLWILLQLSLRYIGHFKPKQRMNVKGSFEIRLHHQSFIPKTFLKQAKYFINLFLTKSSAMRSFFFFFFFWGGGGGVRRQTKCFSKKRFWGQNTGFFTTKHFLFLTLKQRFLKILDSPPPPKKIPMAECLFKSLYLSLGNGILSFFVQILNNCFQCVSAAPQVVKVKVSACQCSFIVKAIIFIIII